MCLALVCVEIVSGTPAAYADGVPGGNISDPVVRATDIAKPAVVRILTQVVGRLTITFSNGQSVTFPQTPQNSVNGYPLTLSGTGAFISAHGDILTADHVVNPVQDDKAGLDQGLQQTAAQDVTNYINQHLNQQVTADQVAQELASGALQSTSQYQTAESVAFLSIHFCGPLSASTLNNVPASQYARVDQIKEHSPFSALDIAIIHVSGMDNMPMLQLGDSSAVQQQDNLTIIGFPGNGDVSTNPTDLLTTSINQVLVSSIKSTDSGAPLIQVGGNVEQGDSGGPALDSKGNVVGIVSFASAATAGSTSFLRPSSGAKQLIQQAGIDTTPSALQQAWSQAFNDYASSTPGHWHKSSQEFQQIVSQYPQFKAVSQFLQYATQQAQTEKTTTSNNNPSGNSSPQIAGGTNPAIYAIGGGGALLLIVLIVGIVALRRRQPALAANQVGSYGTPLATGYANQSYSPAPPGNTPGVSGQGIPVAVPPSPAYPPQSFQQQQPAYRPQSPAAPQQQGYQPAVPQQAYRPQPPQQAAAPLPQQGYQSQSGSQSSISNNMAMFGAPPVTPQPASAASDATLVARPKAPTQWRTWPCGHTNRDDARFCGICGEPAPPVVRRVEQ